MIRGSCLCGDVTYEIDAKISPIWFCHCSKCRRANGSAFHASAVCNTDVFRFPACEDGVREYQDTPGYATRFCGRCGSPVPQRLRGTELVFLHAGSFEGDPERRVAHHIFTGSKAPWFEITDDAPQFVEHRPRSK